MYYMWNITIQYSKIVTFQSNYVYNLYSFGSETRYQTIWYIWFETKNFTITTFLILWVFVSLRLPHIEEKEGLNWFPGRRYRHIMDRKTVVELTTTVTKNPVTPEPLPPGRSDHEGRRITIKVTPITRESHGKLVWREWDKSVLVTWEITFKFYIGSY